MWVSNSGKTVQPQCPTFPCTDTRVYNQGDTLTTATEVRLCHHPNLLHKHTRAQIQNHTVNTHTHTQNQVSMCRQGNQSLFSPGEGVVTVCVYMYLMGSNQIGVFLFATVNGPRTSQISFTSSVAARCYRAANPHTAVTVFHSSGSHLTNL